jgi:hypothetical protein
MKIFCNRKIYNIVSLIFFEILNIHMLYIYDRYYYFLIYYIVNDMVVRVVKKCETHKTAVLRWNMIVNH